ncbi:GumC family protein [Calditrichota bacterium]
MQNDLNKNQITIWDHLAIILKWRKLVFIFMSIMVISSVTYSLLAKKWYFSDARVLPPPSQTMGFGSMLPNLDAGLLGEMTGMENESRLIVAVMDSRRLMDKVINKFEWMKYYKLKHSEDAYKRFNKNVIWETSEEGTFYVRVNDLTPERAAETVNFIVDELAKEYNNITVAHARNQRLFLEKRIDQNRQDLEMAESEMKFFQEKTGAIAIEEQLRSTVQALASIKSEQILAEVDYEVLSKTLPPYSSLVLQSHEKAKALGNEFTKLLYQSDNEAPSALIGLNVAPQIGIKYWQLFREIEMQATILEFLLPQFEQAKITELKEKGDLYILDSGNIPDKRYKPKRAILVLSLLFISFVLLYFYILFIEWLNKLREINPDRYLKVTGVIRGFTFNNLFNADKADHSTGANQ